MSVILTTQEAEMRRITVQSQPGQIVHKTLSRENPSQQRAVEWLTTLSSSLSTAKKKKKLKTKILEGK
jgi:hypothetical protein